MTQETFHTGQSVTGVLCRDGKVLLTRHTYGAGKGRLIVPGGYVESGETPQEALKREFLEETGIHVEPAEIIGIRFNMHDWYVAFRAEYVEGEARSDRKENSEVVWLEIPEALKREDVPDLTRKLIASACAPGSGLSRIPFVSRETWAPYSFYGQLQENWPDSGK